MSQTGCTVLDAAGYVWQSHESKVMSSPIIELLRIFDRSSEIEMAVSFISITGKHDEGVHYHDSHLIGMVVSGQGSVVVPDEGNLKGSVKRLPLKAGDVVTIPPGAFHVLECEPNGKLDFVALEFCDSASGYHITLGPSSIKGE